MSDTSPDLVPEQGSPEPAVKKRTVRRTKSSAEAPAESLADAHSSAPHRNLPPPRASGLSGKRRLKRKSKVKEKRRSRKRRLPSASVLPRPLKKSRRRKPPPNPEGAVLARSLWRKFPIRPKRLPLLRRQQSSRCAGVPQRLFPPENMRLMPRIPPLPPWRRSIPPRPQNLLPEKLRKRSPR